MRRPERAVWRVTPSTTVPLTDAEIDRQLQECDSPAERGVLLRRLERVMRGAD